MPLLGGDGTLSIRTTTTDANGRAQSTLTLGPNFGINIVSVSATGIPFSVTFHATADIPEFLWSIPSGISLIHVPLKVAAVDRMEQTIESVAGLYDALGGAGIVNFLITYNSQTQEWRSYFVPSDKGTLADAPLADDTGIIAGMKAPASVLLSGDPLGTDGNGAITLNQGLNLVGAAVARSKNSACERPVCASKRLAVMSLLLSSPMTGNSGWLDGQVIPAMSPSRVDNPLS